MSETIQGALIGAGSALLGSLLTMLIGVWRDSRAAKRDRIERRFEPRRDAYSRFLAAADQLHFGLRVHQAENFGTPYLVPANAEVALLLTQVTLLGSNACATAADSLMRVLATQAKGLPYSGEIVKLMQMTARASEFNKQVSEARRAFIAAAQKDLKIGPKD